MVDLIKKAFYTGLGLAVLTKEKAEESSRTSPSRQSSRNTRARTWSRT